MHHRIVVEFCNLDIRFERMHLVQFTENLVCAGYIVHWCEDEGVATGIVLTIRAAHQIVRLSFRPIGKRYKLLGDYAIKNVQLANMLLAWFEEVRGHAVIKRISAEQILVESIMFGVLIRKVEISGVIHRVLYQRPMEMTLHHVMEAYTSRRVEQQIDHIRQEVDEQLDRMLQGRSHQDPQLTAAATNRLNELRLDMLMAEM